MDAIATAPATHRYAHASGASGKVTTFPTPKGLLLLSLGAGGGRGEARACAAAGGAGAGRAIPGGGARGGRGVASALCSMRSCSDENLIIT